MPDDVRDHIDGWPELRDAVDDYLTIQGWTRRTCSYGRTYHYKRDKDESRQTYTCLGTFRFLEHPLSKRFGRPSTTGSNSQRYKEEAHDFSHGRNPTSSFADRGYALVGRSG